MILLNSAYLQELGLLQEVTLCNFCGTGNSLYAVNSSYESALRKEDRVNDALQGEKVNK